jgi:F-box interacting protein
VQQDEVQTPDGPPAGKRPARTNLPADVVYEVLRVPAKALCRLRLVCRSWRSLTSDPRFARAHSARHPVLVALQIGDDGEIHILDLSGDIVKRIRGLGHLCSYPTTNDGLVCVSTMAMHDFDANADLVLNPATGAVSILPGGNRPPVVNACVLGRVPSTGEYKVLRLSYYHKEFKDEGFGVACEIIALGGAGDQRWRAKPSPVDISAHPDYIATVDGIAYLLSSLDDGGGGGSSRVLLDVALFDLATEEWRPTPLRGPPSSHTYEETDHIEFACLDGCFAIVHHKIRDRSTDLWFLVDVDNGFWTKRYSMRCAPRWDHAGMYPPRPLLVLDDGRILAWLQKQYVLTAYDPRTETWADLASLSEYYFAMGMHQPPGKPFVSRSPGLRLAPSSAKQLMIGL